PLATKAGSVLGIEGSAALLVRAGEAARLNGLAEKTRFEASNLFELTSQSLAALGTADRWLVDPPREGARRAGRAAGGGLDGAAADRLRQLQPGDPSARRRADRASRRVPLQRGR